MSKQEVNYIGLVSQVLKQARKDAEAAGKAFDQKQAMQSAAARWKVVKAGNDPEFAQGKGAPTRKAKKDGKAAPLPGHKGAPSKTRPGRLDYVTHKGDKFYNRDGHRQDENAEGVKGRPYMGKASGLDVESLGLCPECKEKVSAALASSVKQGKKATKKTRKGGKRGRKARKTAKKSQ